VAPIPPLPTESRFGQQGTVSAAADIGTLYNDDDRSLEEKYGKLIAPRFEIEISDSNDNLLWSAESMVQNNSYDLNGIIINDVTFEEDIESADLISFTVNNPDLTLQDSRLFTEGNNIDLWMGYDGRRAIYMGRAIIVEIEPTFPSSGMPTIRIKAYDKSYFMMEEGRAEIVPEGSEWWQRQREASQQREARQNMTNVNNAYYTREPTEEDLAIDDRINRYLGEDFRQPMTGMDLRESSGGQFDISGSDIESRSVPRWVLDLDAEWGGEESARHTRTSWRRQNFGRRRRNAGKVWKGKTDSEIVSAIFLSYDIDPYVEATMERTRIGRARPRLNNPLGERTGHPAQRGLEGYVVMDEIEDLGVLDPARSSDYVALLEQGHNPFDPDLEGSALLSEEPNRRVESDLGGDEARYQIVDGEVIDFLDAQHAAELDPANADEHPYRSSTNRTTPDRTPSNRRLREVTQKAGTTDWQFISKLAEKHGYIAFVFFHLDSRRWIGYWGPDSHVPQSIQWLFRYNAGDATTLGDVRPNTSVRNQSTEIDLLYVDPVTNRTNRLRVAMDNVDPNFAPWSGVVEGSEGNQDPIGDGPEVTLTIHGQRVRVNADHRFTTAEDARQWLMSYWLRHAEDYMHIEGNTIVGIPECRAREKHEFDGIGRYSGGFFVTQVRHEMKPQQVYKTSFTARKVVDYNEDDLGDDMVVVDQEEIGAGEVAVDSPGSSVVV
jgi:hypothetical protein